MTETTPLIRVGRPPAVRKDGDTYYVRVRGGELSFERGPSGRLVCTVGYEDLLPADVDYGAQVVLRAVRPLPL